MIKFKFSDGRTNWTFSLPFGFLISGWLFMLLMGILHLNVHPEIPAIGYGLSTLIMFIVQLIGWMHSDIGD